MGMFSSVQRLLIVADDFAGAADCAVAFAQRGYATGAILEAGEVGFGGWEVLALDTDTRDCDAAAASERVRHLIGAGAGDATLFKKVDSTLRGNPGPELKAAVDNRAPRCVIAAPAFPATGRTTVDGHQLVDGRWLEQSEFAGQVRTSEIGELLAPVGLPIVEVGLGEVRSGAVARLARDGEPAVLVCDAESDDDLARIACDGLQGDDDVIWWGSAGLARGLAASMAPRPASDCDGAGPTRKTGRPLLLVVGSPAAATREQLRQLRGSAGLREVEVRGGESASDLRGAIDALRAGLRAGCDCALTLHGEPGGRDHGRAGTGRLAAVAAAASDLAGGLVLTGGETARAVLEAMLVASVTLLRELAPGIALGYTTDGRRLSVAIKAGGFGDPDALLICREAMSDAAVSELAR